MDIVNTPIPLKNSWMTAFGVVFVLMILLLIVGTPFWMTNDDPGMAMAAHGFGVVSEGFPPWLVHSNIIWGYLARSLPDVGGVLGYSMLSYLAIVAALTVLLKILLLQSAALIESVLVLMLPGIWAILLPQYTVTAGLLTIAGVLSARQFADDGQKQWLLLAATCFGVACLIRYQMVGLIILLSLPLLPYRTLTDQRVQLTLLVVIVVCLIFWWVDELAYPEEVWASFDALNTARAAYTDYQAAFRLLNAENVLLAHHYSSNDAFLLNHWFFVDPHIADPVRMRALLDAMGPPQWNWQALSSGLDVVEHFPSTWAMLAAAIVMTLLFGTKHEWLCWLLLLVVFLMLGVVGRPAVLHIMMPAYSLVLFVSFSRYRPLQRSIRMSLLTALVCLSGLNLFYVVKVQQSKLDKLPDEESLYRQVVEQGIVVWGDALSTDLVHRPLQADLTIRTDNFFGLHQMTYMPAAYSNLVEHSGHGFIDQLLSADGLQLLSDPRFLPMLAVYCAEHHGRMLESNQSLGESLPKVLLWKTRCYLPLSGQTPASDSQSSATLRQKNAELDALRFKQ